MKINQKQYVKVIICYLLFWAKTDLSAFKIDKKSQKHVKQKY